MPALPNRLSLSKNTLILGIVSFLVDVSSEMIFPLLPIFMTKVLGTSVALVGLMEALAESAMNLSRMAAGWYSDRIGKHKSLVVAGYLISAIIKPFFALAATANEVIVVRFLERVGKGIRGPPKDALIGLSEPKERLGTAFGYRKMLDSAGAVLGPVIAVLLFQLFAAYPLEFQLRSIFIIAVIPIIAALPLVFMLKEIESKPMSSGEILKRLSSSQHYKVFVATVFLFAIGQFSYAFFILRASQFLPIFLVPVAYLLFNILYTISAMPVGFLVDRLGPRTMMAIAFILFIATLIGFAFFPSQIVLFLLFGLYGIFFSIMETTPRTFLVKAAKTTTPASAIGIYQGIVGFAAFPANIIAGLLWSVTIFAVPATFIFSIITSVIALILLVSFVKNDHNI